LTRLSVYHDLYARQLSKLLELPCKPFLVDIVRKMSNEKVFLGFIINSDIGLGLLRSRCSFGLGLALLWWRSCLFGALLVGLGVRCARRCSRAVGLFFIG